MWEAPMVHARTTYMTALLASIALAASAQAQLPERPCRIVFDDQSWGPVDPWTTHGETRLGPRMMQNDGSFVIMGQGAMTITFETNLRDGCTIISGAEKTVPVQVIVSSQNGRTGDVDIIPVDDTHEVTYKCRGTSGTAQTDKGVITPPTVTIQMLHGATANYEDSDPGHRTGNRGVMKIEYCRADPQ
jgi:hypothetical protein